MAFRIAGSIATWWRDLPLAVDLAQLVGDVGGRANAGQALALAEDEDRADGGLRAVALDDVVRCDVTLERAFHRQDAGQVGLQPIGTATRLESPSM